jgi:hypothetical protein
MKQAVGHQECLRHNVAIHGCPRTRNEGREGLGEAQEAKVCVESVDVDWAEPQLGKVKLEGGSC